MLNIEKELGEIGRTLYPKGKRFFTNSWLSGHEDKTPSVLVDVERNRWYDFSTGQGGDSYDIKAFRLGVDRNQLMTDVQVQPEILINEDVKKLWHQNLVKTNLGEECLKLLVSRGVTNEILNKLELGLTLDKSILKDYLYELIEKEKKYCSVDVLCSSFFSTKKVGDKTYYNEMFRDRIMFPIKNEFNQTVGFTGRTIKDDSIKYLNTSETNVFKKKEFLFNINNALSSIKKLKQVYIVEGPFDVIAYMNAGVENVVSTLTCNISEQQLIKLLELGGKNLEFVIAFDNDKAGMNGIKNCMELFKQFSIWNYKIIKYDYKDAGEYIEKGKVKELKELLESPLSIATYLGAFYNKSNSLARKSSYINSFISLIYTFPEFVSNELIKEFSDITDQSDDSFIFGLLMEKKETKEILKFIFYHLKSNKDNEKMFNLMVNEELLSKTERTVKDSLSKFDLSDYENHYKLSNLIIQFIKRRTKEILDVPF